MKHVTGLALLLAGLVGLSFLAQEAGAQEARQELYFSKPQALSKSENALLRGDAETARQLLARALERGIGQRHLYTAHNNLCVALFMLEEYEEAVANCQAAIKLRSNRWRAYNNLGNAFAGWPKGPRSCRRISKRCSAGSACEGRIPGGRPSAYRCPEIRSRTGVSPSIAAESPRVAHQSFAKKIVDRPDPRTAADVLVSDDPDIGAGRRKLRQNPPK